MPIIDVDGLRTSCTRLDVRRGTGWTGLTSPSRKGRYSPSHDRRAGVSDVHDPRRLNPVLVFQQLDASQTQRRRRRNRIHVELAVPSDLAQTRLATTVAFGGRLLDESEDRWRIADPEGNEMVIVSGALARIRPSSTLPADGSASADA